MLADWVNTEAILSIFLKYQSKNFFTWQKVNIYDILCKINPL